MSAPLNEPKSNVWYLLPLFLNLLGGLIMFIALRKENAKKARKGLILGIVVFVITLFMMMASGFLLHGVLGNAT